MTDENLFDDTFVVQVRPGATSCPQCGYELKLRVAAALRDGDARASSCPRCKAGLVAWVVGDPPKAAPVTPIGKAKAPEGEPPGA